MDVPTARLGMRTDGGRIGSSPRSWRLCFGYASHSSWDIWVLLLHLPAPFAVSPGIAWGQSQPPVGPSKKPFPRSGRKVSLLLLDRQAEVGRGSGRGYRRNDIMFQWESQKCSLRSEALAPSPSHSCVML